MPAPGDGAAAAAGVAAGTRLTIDHTAGGHSRETAALDESGRIVLHIKADWATTDADGRIELFNAPELATIAKRSLIDGLISGLIGSSPNNLSVTATQNRGPGQQTVRRATPPIKGMPYRWAHVATVSRDGEPSDGPASYSVEWADDNGNAGLVFVPASADDAPGSIVASAAATGFADPRYATYELRHADGRGVIRHTAHIDRSFNLVRSILTVLDPDFALDEAVILSFARFHAWRT